MDRLAGLPLLPTTIVGSYPQPDWLIDRERLKARLPPRVRAPNCGGYAGALAGRRPGRRDPRGACAIRSRRASTSSATARCGGRATPTASRRARADRRRQAGHGLDRTGKRRTRAARRRAHQAGGPIEAQDVGFLRRPERPVKITLPGPFTMTQQAQNDHYRDR